MTQSEHELLTEVDGIGHDMANKLLAHFGGGYKVAGAACHAWGRLLDVDGFSEDRAKDLFHDMKDAGVYDELRRAKDRSKLDPGS